MITQSTSSTQDVVVNELSRNGYRVDFVSPFSDEAHPTIFMSKRPTHYRTLYAEVGPDASVNGLPLDKFLSQRQ